MRRVARSLSFTKRAQKARIQRQLAIAACHTPEELAAVASTTCALRTLTCFAT